MSDFRQQAEMKRNDALRLFFREVDIKACTHILFSLRSDDAVMVFHHLPAKGEADAGTRVKLAVVQALEQTKYLFGIFLAESNAIIAHHDFMVRNLFR